MDNKMNVSFQGAPGQGGKITDSVGEFRFEATVEYLPSALDNEPWRVTRFHLWTESADNSPTGAPCCIKYESGEWISDPACCREEAATQAALRRLWALPAPSRIS